MFWRVMLTGLSIALFRLTLQQIRHQLNSSIFNDPTETLFGPDFELFASSTFAPLFSSFFIISGILASNILSQYSEAEKLVDEAHATLHTFFDGVVLACGGGPGGVEGDWQETLDALDPVISHFASFVRSWADSLRMSVEKGEHTFLRARKTLDRVIAETARLPVTNHAIADFKKDTAKCVATLSKCSTRINTIRSTIVLQPAQSFQHVLVSLVLASLLVTDFVKSHDVVEFFIVAASASCALLIFSLAQQLDDPFCSSLDSHLMTFAMLEKLLSFLVPPEGGAEPIVHRRRRRKTRGKSTRADNDAESSSSDHASPSTSSPGISAFERELDDMQISVSPLIKTLRRRTRSLRNPFQN